VENKPKSKSPKKRKQINLTHKELEELMNINMQVLRRKNGKWTRK